MTAQLWYGPAAGPPCAGAANPKARRRLSGWWLLLAPILAFDVVLFLTPLGKLVGSSFADNAYQRVLEDPLVLLSLGRPGRRGPAARSGA